MRSIHVTLLMFSVFLLFLTSSCKTLVPTTPLPNEQLGKLLKIKNEAEADGRYLKEMIEKKPEKTMSESIKEMIGAGEEPKTSIAIDRKRYNDVFYSYNSAIGVIQKSIEVGAEPAEYRDSLDAQIEDVEGKQRRLSRYVTQKFGSSRGVVSIIESKKVEVLIEVMDKAWRARREEIQQERQRAIDALEAEKMLSFAEL